MFNWAFARHLGGTFVFRIEDTDASRDSEESYDTLLEVMRWLGFDWDEGPEVGGPYGPYRQSQRMDIYADVAERLLNAGRAYECYCSQEELEARNQRGARAGPRPGYDGHCRDLTAEAVGGLCRRGTQACLRFRMPDDSITFDDLVRGEITFDSEFVPDYVLGPRKRPSALHARQPSRRRVDAHHPCAARRRPAVVDASTDRAV